MISRKTIERMNSAVHPKISQGHEACNPREDRSGNGRRHGPADPNAGRYFTNGWPISFR